MLCSQLGVSYAHSFKSSFISVAEIFPLFIILDRRESNCQKLVAAWGSTKLILEIMHLIANYQEIVLFYKISDAWCTVFCDIYFFYIFTLIFLNSFESRKYYVPYFKANIRGFYVIVRIGYMIN